MDRWKKEVAETLRPKSWGALHRQLEGFLAQDQPSAAIITWFNHLSMLDLNEEQKPSVPSNVVVSVMRALTTERQFAAVLQLFFQTTRDSSDENIAQMNEFMFTACNGLDKPQIVIDTYHDLIFQQFDHELNENCLTQVWKACDSTSDVATSRSVWNYYQYRGWDPPASAYDFTLRRLLNDIPANDPTALGEASEVYLAARKQGHRISSDIRVQMHEKLGLELVDNEQVDEMQQDEFRRRLDQFITQKDFKSVCELWNEHGSERLEASGEIYGQMIRSFSVTEQWDKVLEAYLEALRRLDISAIDPRMEMHLIYALVKLDQPQKAIEAFKFLRKTRYESDHVGPKHTLSFRTYRTAIYACGMVGDVELAETLLREMKLNNWTPSLGVYLSALKAATRARQFDKAWEFYQILRDSFKLSGSKDVTSFMRQYMAHVATLSDPQAIITSIPKELHVLSIDSAVHNDALDLGWLCFQTHPLSSSDRIRRVKFILNRAGQKLNWPLLLKVLTYMDENQWKVSAKCLTGIFETCLHQKELPVLELMHQYPEIIEKTPYALTQAIVVCMEQEQVHQAKDIFAHAMERGIELRPAAWKHLLANEWHLETILYVAKIAKQRQAALSTKSIISIMTACDKVDDFDSVQYWFIRLSLVHPEFLKTTDAKDEVMLHRVQLMYERAQEHLNSDQRDSL